MKHGDEDALALLVTRAKEGDRDAICELTERIQDDVYKLSLRMLGLRADAEDATQEILIKVLTHLAEFRAESSFRTWVWRIAVRHVLRFRKTKREEIASFETIEMLIAKGDENPPLPDFTEAERSLLAREVRLSCTQGMVLSLDRDHRISYVLAEIFELEGDEAAAVLDITPDAYRKRLSRARERLGSWMGKHCGLVASKTECRCERQIPVALAFGVASLEDPEYATHPESRSKRSLPIVDTAREASEIERAANALRDHPDYAAPPRVREQIRAIIDSGRYRMFDA